MNHKIVSSATNHGLNVARRIDAIYKDYKKALQILDRERTKILNAYAHALDKERIAKIRSKIS